MTDALDALRGKLGPLPAWAWGTLAGGAVVTVRALRRRTTTPPPPTPPAGEAPAPEPVAPLDTFAGIGSLFPAIPAAGAYDPTADYPTPTGGASTGAPADNDAWRRIAERWALDNLTYSALVVTTAIQRYLDGVALAYADAAVVNAVIAAIGPPPQSAPPILLQPGVSAGNAPTPPGAASSAPPPPTATVTVPTPSIRLGQRGAAVVELQRELAALGLNPGPIDGYYGARTRAAVLALQQMLGMTGTTGREYGPNAAARLKAYKLTRAGAAAA